MSPKEFAALFRKGEQPTGIDLCGRIVHGCDDGAFLRLSDDPNRKIVFVTDGQGLSHLSGKTGCECLLLLGYTQSRITCLLNEGHRFKLAVFRNTHATFATWDGLAKLVRKVYPEVGIDLDQHLDKLKAWNYPWYEMALGYSFGSVGWPDSRYMTLANYLASRRRHVDLRGFLYHTCHCRELYRGDGWTYDWHGRRQLREYIMADRWITDFPDAVWIELDVNQPSKWLD